MDFNNPALATLSSVAQTAVQSAIKDIHTAMPGIIESFDPTTQTASVQPAVKRIFKTYEEDAVFLTPVNLPLCINVPVVFPRGGGYSFTFPIENGDECLLIFCERSIDYWQKSGGIQEPGAFRFHSLSDAVAHVGLSSQPNAIQNFFTDGMQLAKDDGTASIQVISNEIKIKASTKVTLEAPDTEVVGNLTVTGSTTLGSTVTSGGVNISGSHTHIGSPTAPSGLVSNTGTPL